MKISVHADELNGYEQKGSGTRKKNNFELIWSLFISRVAVFIMTSPQSRRSPWRVCYVLTVYPEYICIYLLVSSQNFFNSVNDMSVVYAVLFMSVSFEVIYVLVYC